MSYPVQRGIRTIQEGGNMDPEKKKISQKAETDHQKNRVKEISNLNDASEAPAVVCNTVVMIGIA